jgi:GTP cyclohydrolase I
LTDVKQASMGHDQAGEMSTIAALDVDPCKLSEMMVAVKVLLRGLGEDVTRDGLLRTPLRVAQAFQSAIKGRFYLCLSVSVSLSLCR